MACWNASPTGRTDWGYDSGSLRPRHRGQWGCVKSPRRISWPSMPRFDSMPSWESWKVGMSCSSSGCPPARRWSTTRSSGGDSRSTPPAAVWSYWQMPRPRYRKTILDPSCSPTRTPPLWGRVNYARCWRRSARTDSWSAMVSCTQVPGASRCPFAVSMRRLWRPWVWCFQMTQPRRGRSFDCCWPLRPPPPATCWPPIPRMMVRSRRRARASGC